MPFDPSANYYEDPSDYDSELEQAQNPLAANPQLALRNPPPVTAPGPWSQKRDAAATQLADQGNVRPALWRSLLAGGAEFMLGRRHPQAAQVFGDAITQSDPNVRANLNLQRRYGVLEKQAEQERLQQTQQRMEQYQQGLLGARARALDANTQAGQEKRLAQAANNGFTPSPSSVDLPAPGAVPSPDLPPPIRAMSPQTMNTPLPPGALPPLAPVGSVPAKVSGQQGYYIPPAERERMKKEADAKAAREAYGNAPKIPTPPALLTAVPGLGPEIPIADLPKYADILKNPPRVPLDQQYVDEYLKKHPGSSIADAVKAHKKDTAAPERESHALMIGPDNRVLEVRPGQTVPSGAVTPAGMSSQNVPTSTTRTMAEAAPKVMALADRVNGLIDQQVNSLGPAASRWNEFMAGKVGAPNPEFTKLRTDVGLLQTLLMRMHVGARGGEQIMQHFRDLLDSSKQSPENLRAALGEISAYAKEVAGAGRAGGEHAAAPDDTSAKTAPKIVKWGRDAQGNPVPLP